MALISNIFLPVVARSERAVSGRGRPLRPGSTATLAGGKINRRGANLSTVAPNETDYWEVEIGHRRPFWIGEVRLGLGYEYRKDQVTEENDDDFRAFLEWRFAR